MTNVSVGKYIKSSVTKKMKNEGGVCLYYSYPQLSQRVAKPPDRIGQPFFHSTELDEAHIPFMQTPPSIFKHFMKWEKKIGITLHNK